MADLVRREMTILDLMILIAAVAAGSWGATAYRAGIPLPFIARPGYPMPFFLSVPLAAALTWGFLVVPVRTLRARTRRMTRHPGTALCTAAAAASLGVLARWSLRVWITPYMDGSPFLYGAKILYDWASWCGLGVVAALALLALGGRLRRPTGWIEAVRLTLGAYWLAVFLILGAI